MAVARPPYLIVSSRTSCITLSLSSCSPIMADQLSYLESKSHAYIFAKDDQKISRADENFAREGKNMHQLA